MAFDVEILPKPENSHLLIKLFFPLISIKKPLTLSHLKSFILKLSALIYILELKKDCSLPISVILPLFVITPPL